MTRVEETLDGLARRLARPMRRRRALGVIGGGVASVSLSRAAVALAGNCENEQSCEDNRTFCVGASACGFSGTNSFGCKTCNLQCCYGGNRVYEAVTCCEGTRLTTGEPAKWCCSPQFPVCGQFSRDCLCPGGREPCGPTQNICCRTDQQCINEGCVPLCKDGGRRCTDGTCCPPDTYCCREGCCPIHTQCCEGNSCCEPSERCCFGSTGCCPSNMKCSGADTCDCISGAKCKGDCCPPGTICCGSVEDLDTGAKGAKCCTPYRSNNRLLKYTGALNALRNALGIGAGAGGPALRRRTALARASAAEGANGARRSLAAVADQAALALAAFDATDADSAAGRAMKPARPALAAVVPGAGLDAAAAAALNALLADEAKAWALVHAAGTAKARSLGALRKRDGRAARRQSLAAAGFADQAAKILRGLPSQRKAVAAALRKSGTVEVTVTAAQVTAFQATVRSSGLPAELQTMLKQLGLTSADIKKVRAAIVAGSADLAVGPVLLAPLESTSEGATLTSFATELAAYAKAARKAPLQARNPGPARIRRQNHRRRTD